MITKEEFLSDFKTMLSTEADIEMETDLLDIDEWGSFSAMAFLSMVEEKYNIKVNPFFIAEAIYVEDLYSLVNKLLTNEKESL